MTSENPFENGAALGGRAAVLEDTPAPSDEQLTPPPLEVVDGVPEPDPEPPTNAAESATARTKKPTSQVQPPPAENDVDVDLAGKTPSENDTDDAVEAEVVDDSDEPLDAETSTELQEWTPPPFPSCEPNWPYDQIEYKGYALNVRIPTSQALTGFTMATGQYIPDQIKQAMVSKFVHLHFSPQSFAFLQMRLMDPDGDFDEETFGDIVRILVEKAGEKVIAAAEAKAALEKKNKRKRSKR